MGLLTGKTAFVSGGTRGIGLAIAERLAREGADVMVLAAVNLIAMRRLRELLPILVAALRAMLPTCEHLKGARLCSTRKVKRLILVIF